MSEVQAAYFVVHGTVQGVGFRAFVQSRATALGITGWVRNRDDGRAVEILAEGLADALEQLAEALRCGPPSASVLRVERSNVRAVGEFVRFDIRH